MIDNILVDIDERICQNLIGIPIEAYYAPIHDQSLCNIIKTNLFKGLQQMNKTLSANLIIKLFT